MAAHASRVERRRLSGDESLCAGKVVGQRLAQLDERLLSPERELHEGAEAGSCNRLQQANEGQVNQPCSADLAASSGDDREREAAREGSGSKARRASEEQRRANPERLERDVDPGQIVGRDDDEHRRGAAHQASERLSQDFALGVAHPR